MPINWRENGTVDGVKPTPKEPHSDLKAHGAGSTLYLTSHLFFTYLFTILALIQLHRTYARFVHARQLFSLDHGHSIPARTVFISRLPLHLRSERALADYWDNMGEGMIVESISVARQVTGLEELLVKRTEALQRLELAWTKYVWKSGSARPSL